MPKYVLGLVVALVQLPISSNATPALTLSITNPVRTGFAGDVETFAGVITNDTGFTLDSSDLFLNFSGYDPVNVELDQTLGASSFTVADGATSNLVDLFTFSLATGAPAPGAYLAQVVLEDSSGDLSAIQTAEVDLATPEPGCFLLGGIGLFLIFGSRLRRKSRLLVPVLVFAATATTEAQVSAVQLVSKVPGISQAGGAQPLLVALPILNSGSVTAENVQVTEVVLRSAALISPAVYPVALGNIGPDESAVFQANFGASGLLQHTNYLLTVRGTYQVGGATAGFTINRFLEPPPISPGSGNAGVVSVVSNTVSGAPYTSQPPNFDNDVNEARPPVPTGPLVPGVPSPNSTAPQRMPSAGPVLPRIARPDNGPNAVSFAVNNSLGLGGASGTAEPSGDVAGSIVFNSANWLGSYSSDGGTTFAQLDPTSVFPNDIVGYCCDQLVLYVPKIDRFIWVLQGNGYRVASASPAQVISSKGRVWTYWNLTPQLFGQPSGTGFDYPDISLGTNYIYLSWDVGFPACPSGCTAGHQVARISISEIAAGGTINIGYTNPPDSNVAWGAHLTQDTGDEIFWAGHNNTSSMRVFSWAESTGTYFWRDVGVSSWANNKLTSTTPDGQDWMSFLSGFPGNSIIGSTRSGNQLWFAWSAGTDNNFKQPHVEMVSLDRSKNFSKSQQVQIWNSSYAFGYPALATNACTGEVGLSLEYGGNGNYENHVVGFWGDFIVYVTTNSNVGSNRFGDYVTIRQDSTGLNGAYFDAFGYGLNSVSGNTTSDVHYVVFGRPGGCNIQ